MWITVERFVDNCSYDCYVVTGIFQTQAGAQETCHKNGIAIEVGFGTIDLGELAQPIFEKLEREEQEARTNITQENLKILKEEHRTHQTFQDSYYFRCLDCSKKWHCSMDLVWKEDSTPPLEYKPAAIWTARKD